MQSHIKILLFIQCVLEGTMHLLKIARLFLQKYFVKSFYTFAFLYYICTCRHFTNFKFNLTVHT